MKRRKKKNKIEKYDGNERNDDSKTMNDDSGDDSRRCGRCRGMMSKLANWLANFGRSSS